MSTDNSIVLIDCIRNSQVITFQYKGFEYLFEPYLIHLSRNGVKYVHGYKISGGGLLTEAPHFGNFFVDEISNIERTGYTFIAPKQKYNPRSKMFYQVIFEWDRRND